jgi:hypothetical protein
LREQDIILSDIGKRKSKETREQLDRVIEKNSLRQEPKKKQLPKCESPAAAMPILNKKGKKFYSKTRP